MTVYQLNIPIKPNQGMAVDNRLDSIYAYLETYMGEPGLTMLFDDIEPNTNDYYNLIGKYTNYIFSNKCLDSNLCYALVFMSFGDVTEILYLTDGDTLQWDKSFTATTDTICKASTQVVIDDLKTLKKRLYKDIIDGIGSDSADYDTPIKLSYKDVTVDLFICPEIFEGVENLINDTIDVLVEDYM